MAVIAIIITIIYVITQHNLSENISYSQLDWLLRNWW